MDLIRNPAFGRRTIQTVSCHRIEDRAVTTVITTTPTTTTSSAVSSSGNSAQSMPVEGTSSKNVASLKPITEQVDAERNVLIKKFNEGDEESFTHSRNDNRRDEIGASSANDASLRRNDDLTGNATNSEVTACSTVHDVTDSQSNFISTDSSHNNSNRSAEERIGFHDNIGQFDTFHDRFGNSERSARRINSNNIARTAFRHRRRRADGTMSQVSRVWTNLNNIERPFRSEIWNVDMGQGDTEVFATQVTIASTSSEGQGFGDLTLASRSSIPVYSFISYPSEMRYSSSISGIEPDGHAVATATARTPRHVHTAVVIAGSNEAESENALRTAINRAIAGAFAGNGEGAVAANIVNTTYRLQLWDISDDVMVDISQCMLTSLLMYLSFIYLLLFTRLIWFSSITFLNKIQLEYRTLLDCIKMSEI